MWYAVGVGPRRDSRTLWTRLGRRLAAGAVLLGAGGLGCAWTSVGVSSDYSTTCGFAGRDTTACGKCIAKSCQKPVDACCADATCKASNKTDYGFGITSGDDGTLGRLDACGDGKSCYDLESDPLGKAIAECVEASCSDVCDTRKVSQRRATDTSCSVKTSYDKTTYCTCVVPSNVNGKPSSGNDQPCSRSFGVCCADLDWPSPASECTCTPPSCNVYAGDVCICEKEKGSKTAETCGRGVCCQTSDGTCRCDPTKKACDAGQTPVDSCTTAQVGCGSGKRAVTSCSAQ